MRSATQRRLFNCRAVSVSVPRVILVVRLVGMVHESGVYGKVGLIPLW